jgi:scyllo-inositol 2-dehydrogenase (NADP+)
MDRINVGLASFGMSGMVFHAPLLTTNPGFHLGKILERTPKGSKRIYPEVTVVNRYDDLINDPELELIVVNTPDHTHFDLTRKALLAGKHVIVEKPFTICTAEGSDLIELARKKNLVLTVFQNRRWDGDFLTVSRVVKEGMVGRLVEFESHFDRFRNYIQEGTWKEDPPRGTGNIYNLGSHMIDQALILFGMPEGIYADLEIRRDGSGVNDYYDIHLYYHRFKAILKSSYLVREPGPRYLLHGTLGTFVKYGIDPQEELLKSGAIPVGEDWGREDEQYWGILNSEIGGEPVRKKLETIPGNYHPFYDNLFYAIREGKEPAVKPEEALHVIGIIEAAIASNRDKCMVKL